MEYEKFSNQAEKVNKEKNDLIESLIKAMGGKVRYYRVLAIADECKPFSSDNIPKEIVDIFRNEEELNIYKQMVDKDTEFANLWAKYTYKS